MSALVIANCFPELNLQAHKKSSVAKGYWNDLNHQKAFLENLARKLGKEALSVTHT